MFEVSCVEPGSSKWPTQLFDLDDETPSQVFVRGNGSLRRLAANGVSIVGSRNASAYGRAVVRDIVQFLVENGQATISGGALGIDVSVHRCTVEAGGASVVVLASSVDQPTPKGNATVISSCLDNGVIVSESSSGHTPRAHDFLFRNRLIAALTRVTVVVEADVRSGALNTARWAADLGRTVFAIPGSVFSTTSRGTHALIAGGDAQLLYDWRQLLPDE